MKRVKHSAKLSEIEIDMRLKEYFSDHQIMQRSDFQGITGMVRSTAMIHIRRLRQEGKPQNIGIPSQPTYVPAPGFMESPEIISLSNKLKQNIRGDTPKEQI